MNILAFDTSFGACSAALAWQEGGERRVSAQTERMAKGHAERLIPLIDSVLKDARLEIANLDAIAVTTGPGTFTGVRIAIAAARAFALAADVPVYAASSLHLMARQAKQLSTERLAVAVDARRGQVYLQTFDRDARPSSAPALRTVAEAARETASAGIGLVVGSGAPLVAAAAASLGLAIEARLPNLEPDARDLLDLEGLAPERPLRPLYLRPPDAVPPPDAAIARRA